MKIIEVLADAGHHDTIVAIAEQQQVEDIYFTQKNENGRNSARLLGRPENRQKVLDALQTILYNTENYRVLIIPLDTALPKLFEPEAKALTEKQQAEEKNIAGYFFNISSIAFAAATNPKLPVTITDEP
jgi:hypothetical protein